MTKKLIIEIELTESDKYSELIASNFIPKLIEKIFKTVNKTVKIYNFWAASVHKIKLNIFAKVE